MENQSNRGGDRAKDQSERIEGPIDSILLDGVEDGGECLFEHVDSHPTTRVESRIIGIREGRLGDEQSGE